MIAPSVFLAAAGGTLLAQVLTTMVAFFAVLFTLYKVAWGPVIRLLDERRKSISDEFESIEKQQASLASRIKDYEERLSNIDIEARERINKAVEDARKASEQLLAEAQAAANETRTKAQSEIRVEIEKARVQLRDEVVKLTIGATEKLLAAKLDDDRHKKLVNGFIDELQKREAS
jgi:F-type H+-transporting ATPase subunit b